MSDIPISKMNDRQLRGAVQELYDELAVFKRKYEDTIYNLDYDNFGKSFTVSQKNMKAQIKMSADAIKTMVSEADLQTELEKYSTAEQTADAITTTVTAEYINNLIRADYVTNAVFRTAIEQSAQEIKQAVSETYQTKNDADGKYNSLDSKISQTADSITGIVSKNIAAYFTSTVIPTQDNTTAEERSMLCLYNGSYYYYNDIEKEWLSYPAEGIKSMFKQTPLGFELSGDVSISGDMITSGNIKGLNISTADNIFGDGIRLNSNTNRLEAVYTGAAVGALGVTVGGMSIYPIDGATLYISDVKALGKWDFSQCEEIIGL